MLLNGKALAQYVGEVLGKRGKTPNKMCKGERPCSSYGEIWFGKHFHDIMVWGARFIASNRTYVQHTHFGHYWWVYDHHEKVMS